MAEKEKAPCLRRLFPLCLRQGPTFLHLLARFPVLITAEAVREAGVLTSQTQ